MRPTEFGYLGDGRPVTLYTLGASGGVSLEILSYGAIVHSLTVPVSGNARQVVASLRDLAAYEKDRSYRNCIIGRTVNRVAKARFERAGEPWKLSVNDPPNSLHGGTVGFNRHIWTCVDHTPRTLTLEHISPHLDQGYPGTVVARVTFEIVGREGLRIIHWATVDRPSPVDLTHHLYFNLEVHEALNLGGHSLCVRGNHIIELEPDYTPTGRLSCVAHTPFDLNIKTLLAKVLTSNHPQLTSIGLNQAWILERDTVQIGFESPDGELTLEIATDAPTVQLYSGLSDGDCAAGALAIEPQGYTDALNNAHFPTPWIYPGVPFRRETTYQFNARP